MSTAYYHTEYEDEIHLRRLISQGDEMAFAQLMRRYTPQVYSHLLTYVKNSHRAQELTQDIFLSVWRHRDKLGEMVNFPGYLYVMTRNKAQRALQEALKQLSEPPEDKIQTLLHNPDTSLELKELEALLNRGIDLLPPRRRKVFKLSRIDSFSYEEIADQLAISKSAVKQHIIAALVFLRQYIKDQTGTIVSVATLYYYFV